MKPERVGDYYALACALAYGLGNIPAKIALTDMTPELFNIYLFASAFLITSFSLFSKKARVEIFTGGARAIGLILVLSVIFSFGIYTFMSSLKLAEPATVSFLSRFEVIVIIVLAYFILKERLRFIEIIGGLIAIGGVIVLKYETDVTISKAASLMILSSFFFATAEIIIKKNINTIGTVRFIFWRNLFMVGIFYLILSYHRQEIRFPDYENLMLITLTALLLPVLGRVTYIEALKRIKISRAALISQSTPFFTALSAFIILRSLPTPIEWLGGGLIAVGVVVIKMSAKRMVIK